MLKDKDMRYDEKRKRYILTKDYVKNELGTDLQMILYDELDTNTGTLPDRVLKYTSNMIYDYLKVNCEDYNYVCVLVETDEEYHEAFKDMLAHQLMYFIQKGDMSLSASEDMTKYISPRAMQIIIGYRFLSAKKVTMSKRLINEFIYFNGGGIY